MDNILKSTLLDLTKGVEGTAISADGKHTVAWCLGKLPALYAHYQATLESRYGDEITRLVQATVKELTRAEAGCPKAMVIGTSVIARFQTLHEELRLPALALKSPAKAPAPRVRKKAARA